MYTYRQTNGYAEKKTDCESDTYTKKKNDNNKPMNNQKKGMKKKKDKERQKHQPSFCLSLATQGRILTRTLETGRR